MLNIREQFVSKISDKALYSIGTYVVLVKGMTMHRESLAAGLDAPMVVAAGPPDVSGVRVIKYQPTNSQASEIVAENNYMIFEAFLAELVQIWFDFLADIYEQAIEDNLQGKDHPYPIPEAKVKVDFSLSGFKLNQQLKKSARKDFDFLPAKDKLKIVRKTLQKDLSGKEAQLKLIKTNIYIRNILQHGNGIVSSEALKDLGVDVIQEDHGNRRQDVLANQKVSVTPYDIENFVDAMIEVAQTLIP
ncbi:MAG: hypothetical protein RLZZ511_216 [Cyanobacteriota bacterium]|jgi:hypothetical protein